MNDKLRHQITHRASRRAFSTGRIALSAGRLAGRRLLRRAEGVADGQLGAAIAKEMDEMKGMAMKVGQILSYFDGVLPDEAHTALRTLQRGANPLDFEALRPALEEALGAPVEELFEALDPTPVAAASIGQVHRGQYKGAPVAVKIQYPNVRRTFEEDFGRISKIAGLASLVTAVDGQAIADDLRTHITEECNYLREAAHQQAFAARFASDSQVAVPQVVAARSAMNVLTSNWCEGRDFYAFTEEASPDERNAVAQVLVRFAFRSLFELGTINADPHPGNYLFVEDGRVVFLDFGCVRRFDRTYIEAERRLARCVVDDRRDEFRDAALATGMVTKQKKFDFDEHWRMLRHQYGPYLGPSFRFSRDYLAAGVEFTQPNNPNLRRIAIPPPWIWQTRLLWGLHAVLTRLEAEGDFATPFREALDAPWTPLEVPG